MRIFKFDKENRFKSQFNTNTGFYMRTGILDENGEDTGADPFMTSFPELIDIGIMGHCAHGLSGKCKESGVQCYQHGDICKNNNMTLEDYKSIIDECKGKTFQVALGGCGDPDMHENFEEILEYTRGANIVPNFTTSGFGMNPEKAVLCKRYCGAVAVSWYRSKYTFSTIQMLFDAGVTTNVHFVIGNNTIDEAIDILEGRGHSILYSGVNAMIFLLHKPVGLGEESNILKCNDPKVKKFFHLIDSKDYPFQIGFDSCTVPGIINFTHTIDENSLDTCEAARWSMYITPDMKGLPCSFDNQEQKYAVDIKKAGSIKAVWDSEQFEIIRNKFRSKCPNCSKRNMCFGGCPLMDNITLCNNL